jgi:hypothetical protein
MPSERAGLNLAHLQHGLGKANISYDCQPAKPGENLTQEFEPLAGKVGLLGRQSGDVAARLRQTCDQSPPTGSIPNGKTMGMTDVACFTVRAANAFVTITSTFMRTNSAAISAPRSGRPSDQRYSIAMVRPSIQPSSRSRCTKAAVQGLQTEASVPKNPMVGSFPGCCARAAIGHAIAPPSTVMNSRRFIAPPRPRSRIVAAGTGRLEVAKTALGNVRFGSKADIPACSADVRFTPKRDIAGRNDHVRFVPKDGVIGRRSCG